MVRQTASATADGATPTERAKDITKPFGDDEELNSWAARLIASADNFQKAKRSDPLAGFLVMKKR